MRIAIPAGRLLADSLLRLNAAGLLDQAVRRRALLLEPSSGLEIAIAKPLDIALFVRKGVVDAGIVGRDLLLELEPDVCELLDLGFGQCRGVLAFPLNVVERWRNSAKPLRIATKYPRLASQYFDSIGRQVDVIELHGATEVAPLVGLTDGIVDIVYTGFTLQANRLVEVAEVFRSSARLIVNRTCLESRANAIKSLLSSTGVQSGIEGLTVG